MRLKLPNATYKTELFDGETKEWQAAESSLICYDYVKNTEAAETRNTCDLFVRASIPAQSQVYLRLNKSTAPATVESGPQEATSATIKTSSQSLTLTGTDESEIELEYTDKDGKSYALAFGLQYYNPSNGTFEGNATLPSGAYIFKPKMDDQVSHPYSKMASYVVQPAEGSSTGEAAAAAMIFNFESESELTGTE